MEGLIAFISVGEAAELNLANLLLQFRSIDMEDVFFFALAGVGSKGGEKKLYQQVHTA